MTNVIYFSTGKEDEVYELPLWAEVSEAVHVARANLADLKAVDGVSKKLAQTVYDYFHENG